MSKPKQMLDAVKTATSIHNGDFSSLRGKSFLICDSIETKKRRSKLVNKSKKKKYTLNQIGDLVVEMSSDLKQVNIRLDNLEKDVKGLKQDVKHINARLDYNNLKKLPENR